MIESEPDSLTSEEESCGEDINEKLKEEKRIEERVKKIEATKIGLREFLQVLDYRMLGYFVKSILIYAVIASILCIFYVLFIYNFNKVHFDILKMKND